jgi:hypothetical protein
MNETLSALLALTLFTLLMGFLVFLRLGSGPAPVRFRMWLKASDVHMHDLGDGVVVTHTHEWGTRKHQHSTVTLSAPEYRELVKKGQGYS